MLVELLRGDLALDDDVGDDAVAEPVVGRADDRDLPDGRVARDDVLDLERVHVLAAGDDHVVEPAVEPEVAVLVEPPDVAGVVPAVANLLLVRIRPVPVAGERLIRGHVAEDLAVLAEPQARVQRRPPRAPRLRTLVAVDRVGVDLGRAVVVDEQPRRERLGAALDERARHRRAGVGERLDRRDVVVAEPRVPDDVVVERRREVQRGDALLLDQRAVPPPRPSPAGRRSSRRSGASRSASACPSCGRAACSRASGRRSGRPGGRPARGRRRGRRGGSAGRPSGGRSCRRCRASGSRGRPRTRARRGAGRRPGARARRRPRGTGSPPSPRGSRRCPPPTPAARSGRTSRRATGTPSRAVRTRGGGRTTAASRSPVPSPSAARPPASRATRSCSAAYVKRVSPWTTASASGFRSAA